MRDEVSIHIEAPSERVYDLVSDITRMGEWSPECHKAEWLDGASGPAEGATFKGHNKKGWVRWSNTSTVTSADRPREFAFSTGATQWGYRLADDGSGGTKVTEWFEELTVPGPVRALIYRLSVGGDRDRQLREGMQATLARLKAAAEGEAEVSVDG